MDQFVARMGIRIDPALDCMGVELHSGAKSVNLGASFECESEREVIGLGRRKEQFAEEMKGLQGVVFEKVPSH